MRKSFFILIFLLFLFFILFVNACAKQQNQNSIPAISANDVSKLTPEQVVILYFQSWNNKKYDVMYSLISDGFKKIEPTANTFDDFQLYMDSFFETEKSVNILESKQAYQSENEAGVNYRIEITRKDSSKKEFENAYTLKKRENGWKLIHPYGENIDTS